MIDFYDKLKSKVITAIGINSFFTESFGKPTRYSVLKRTHVSTRGDGDTALCVVETLSFWTAFSMSFAVHTLPIGPTLVRIRVLVLAYTCLTFI